MTYPNEIFSAFAFLGFILCCIPFPWHLEAWNTGTCLYMAWTGLACLNQFINSVVWKGNVINWAPVWCDISARIIIGTAVAIPAASLCINRRLYHISCVRSVTVSKAEKRRAVMVDLAIGLGIPLMHMVLQYIPQGHRFDIWEDIGCFPFTYNTPVGVFFMSIPPILIGLVSGVYGVLSIRAFLKLGSQFAEVLSVNNNLRVGRYLRLMVLSGIETISTLSIGFYALYLNCTHIETWKGWDDTHSHFSFVGQIPAVLWRGSPLASSLEMSRWLVVICAFVFFMFFGFAEEARKNYRSVVDSVAKHVGVSTTSNTTFGSGIFTSSNASKGSTSEISTGGSRAIPVFVRQGGGGGGGVRKHVSLDTLSDMTASFIDDDGGSFILNEKDNMKDAEHVKLEMTDDGLVLQDVGGGGGGVLADLEQGPYSPAPSSGTCSVYSVASLPETTPPQPPLPPPHAITRPDVDSAPFSEVSSVRYSRGVVEETLSAPARALDIFTTRPRRRSFDGSSSPV